MHSLYSRIPSRPEANIPLPSRLEGLRRLAYNTYWTWNAPARDLFKRIENHTWSLRRNPIAVLEARTEWDELLDHASFIAEYESCLERFDAYMKGEGEYWFARQAADRHATFHAPVAYFCAEFGLHESINLYSGGLGILAGDHLKAASDLGLPFVAVGLFYRQGYFRQSIDADGHQEHAYPALEPEHLPIERVMDPRSGRPLVVGVEFPDRTVSIAVHMIRVGRVPLILLDTDIPENAAADRPITAQLYVRGREMRLHQEIVLGVGGVRALHALGIEPSAWHLNEGHSAFMLVERIRERVKAGVDFDRAHDEVKKNAIFTIHTPVSAGNERFDASLVRRLTNAFLKGSGVEVERVIALGKGPDNDAAMFDMTAFSLRTTLLANAVSQLHKDTANGTWNPLGVNILGVTNGVHMPTWIGPAMAKLFYEHGSRLQDPERPTARPLWNEIDKVSSTSLWQAHRDQKRRLVLFVRKRLRDQLARHGEAPSTLSDVSEAFDPEALIVGFARRFATYKRASLIFSDEERLARILWNKERPVQLLFAGKAHPADRPGQKMIEELFHKSRSDRFRGRVFIVEDYDMRIGRFLTQGVDVWMNNPRRPLEASGTSGMKAAANGVPNLSILDGWWDEAYDGKNGWAIGGREMSNDQAAQDRVDAEALYRLLEGEVAPAYYASGKGKLSEQWATIMRASIASSLWQFSMSRCVCEYTERMYTPAAHKGR